MERESMRIELAEWLRDILDREPPELTDDVDLVADVGLDSLALAELAARTRHKLKVRLRVADLQGHTTVGQLLDLVAAMTR